jgi:hypothetical protein
LDRDFVDPHDAQRDLYEQQMEELKQELAVALAPAAPCKIRQKS